ncbi:MAG: hypothetical protein IKD28_03145 [Clostridia bacterium]|nr:hypothetical protein [Clostridia bacterium]
MERGKIAFARLCHEELSRDKLRDGIGLYAEKRLHGLLKRWVFDDLSAHEQKVAERGGKQSRFVADVLTPDGEIFEIQTAKLYPLRKKIAFYMEKTDYRVTLVHPLAVKKYVSWLDPTSGEVTKRTRVSRTATPLTGISELRPFLKYLDDPRFSVMFPLVELDEYRLLDGWSRDRKRGSHRYELIPLALHDTCVIESGADILAHFPEGLPDEFVAKDFAKATRLQGYALYDALAVFVALGAIAPDGKRGRAVLYRKAK